MIFATVGTQLPFPRFLKILNELAHKHHLDIFAQTASAAQLEHLKFKSHLSPSEFRGWSEKASIIAGHAGIGTLLTGLKLQKPLVLFPRRESLGEHRNDHQVATARALEGVNGVYIAWDARDLEKLLTTRKLRPGELGSSVRREQLINFIRADLLSDLR